MKPNGGNSGVNDNLSEIADKEINRIEQKQALRGVTVVVDCVEDGRHIHQELSKDRPEVLNITEEDEQCRENQANANVEQHQTSDWIQQADELPCEGDIIQNTEQDEHTQGQPEVDESLDILREQKQMW